MAVNVDLSTVTYEQRAQIIREERDALIIAWQRGTIQGLMGAEKLLNERIKGLGVDTLTGDTTEES